MENIKEQIEREKLFRECQQAYKSGHLLLEGATGSGKTLVGIKLIKERERWLIVVPKLVLIDNWKAEFKEWGYEDLLKNVEFITYASLEKYASTQIKRNIILDEAHNMNERRLVAIKDITNVYALTKVGKGRGHVIALSGSVDEERRHLFRELKITSLNTVVFKTDKAVEAEIVSDYKILVVHVPLNNSFNQILRLNKWKNSYNQTEFEVYQFLTTKYNDCVEAGGDTKFPILDRMQFLYHLPSKIKAAKLVLKQLDTSRRVLTFGSSIKQIEELCEHTHHNKKSKKDTSFEDFKSGKIDRLGAIQTIAEGVNIPNLDTGFIVQAMSKNRHMIQRLGRLLRKEDENPDKKATLIVLSIEDTQDGKWVKNSLGYFDKNKVHHTSIKEVEQLGIERILSTL